jgi:hypothetical protein
LPAQEKKEKMDKNKEITNNPITSVSNLFFVWEGDNTMFRIPDPDSVWSAVDPYPGGQK